MPNRGIPIAIEVLDPIVLPELLGVQARVSDLQVQIDAKGQVTTRFSVAAQRGGLTVASDGPMTARPVAGWRAWSVQGAARLQDGPPLDLSGRLSRKDLRMSVRDRGGGSLDLQLDRIDDDVEVTADAANFDLGLVGPALADVLGQRGLVFDEATLDGRIELGMQPVRAHFDALSVRGLRIQHDKLYREPIDLRELTLHGDAGHDGQHGWLQLTAAHEQAQVFVSASLDETLRVHAELPRTSCQDLLDAVPDALAGIARGSRLQGELEGELDLAISLPQLSSLREQDEQAFAGQDPPRAGSLQVSFPFLERCTMQADAPDLDLHGLHGPYRHRFIDGTGRARTRILAPGGRGYVSRHGVDLIADAFVVLEDARFFEHDGFDREQMNNAFWHNLRVGRIARGASTISQQTARNLFLGVDRTLGRKLQEAFVTWRLEAEVPKERILELYLNVIELAPGVHGVQDAAQFYFGKPAANLTVLQAVHLASMAPAPHTYAERFASGAVDEDWMDELRRQVHRLYLHRVITGEQMRGAKRDDLQLLDRTAG